MSTEKNPCLSSARTPLIHEALTGLLFVGFAHNLLLESYVSRLTQVEKQHPGTHALTCRELFLYKTRQTQLRAARCEGTLRSGKHGGLRAKAKERRASITKSGLRGANRNKLQLTALCKQSEAASARYDLTKVRRRGAGSVRRRLKEIRAQYETNRRMVADRKVDSQHATCRETKTGRKRKAALMPAACSHLVPKLAPARTKARSPRLPP